MTTLLLSDISRLQLLLLLLLIINFESLVETTAISVLFIVARVLCSRCRLLLLQLGEVVVSGSGRNSIVNSAVLVCANHRIANVPRLQFIDLGGLLLVIFEFILE